MVRIDWKEVYHSQENSAHCAVDIRSDPFLRTGFSILSRKAFRWVGGLAQMPAEPSVLEQVKSCGSVSCLINMEPSELLHLQPSEPIASESVPFLERIEKPLRKKWTTPNSSRGSVLRGHLGVPDTVSGPLNVPLNYLVILH